MATSLTYIATTLPARQLQHVTIVTVTDKLTSTSQNYLIHDLFLIHTPERLEVLDEIVEARAKISDPEIGDLKLSQETVIQLINWALESGAIPMSPAELANHIPYLVKSEILGSVDERIAKFLVNRTAEKQSKENEMNPDTVNTQSLTAKAAETLRQRSRSLVDAAKEQRFIVGTIGDNGMTISFAERPATHETYTEAANEAERLATVNPGKRYTVAQLRNSVIAGGTTWN